MGLYAFELPCVRGWKTKDVTEAVKRGKPNDSPTTKLSAGATR